MSETLRDLLKRARDDAASLTDHEQRILVAWAINNDCVSLLPYRETWATPRIVANQETESEKEGR